MGKYLYGAAVQGIQGFIFQTNKLREIVGASELVKEICEDLFRETVGGSYCDYDGDKGSILRAAGNIKYIFDSKEECEKVVREFPRKVLNYAPGITISQAVVKMEGEFESFETAVNKLESKLHVQRNKPMRSLTLGLMGIERSRQTGLPIISKEILNGELEEIDDATWSKLYEYYNENEKKQVRRKTTLELSKLAFGIKDLTKEQLAFEISEVCDKNNWIAVVHADGNGLGSIVQKIGTDAKRFKNFSENLDKATTAAAVEAFNAVKGKFEGCEKYPIRPIVLGGDDLTVICRADLAINYTQAFLKSFETHTEKLLGSEIKEVFGANTEGGLTACAGIAFIKSSYPFYYGYELAESLCGAAKNDAKDSPEIKAGKKLPLSCLMFHKVQDSFVEDYKEMVARELTPDKNTSFKYGPYYLTAKEGRWTIDTLKGNVEKLEKGKGNAIKSHLRNWLNLLHDDKNIAQQKLDRLKSLLLDGDKAFVKNITTAVVRKEKDEDGNDKYVSYYPVYDMLAINTIINQETLNKNEESKI
jgi:hypothetical protein